MQSQDCWYWMPVAVAVTHCSVSDNRCTVWWGKVWVKEGEGSELGRGTGAKALGTYTWSDKAKVIRKVQKLV